MLLFGSKVAQRLKIYSLLKVLLLEHLFFEQLPFITLIVGVLLAVGAILGRLGRFIGLPAGLLFLVVGMLIGEDGYLGH